MSVRFDFPHFFDLGLIVSVPERAAEGTQPVNEVSLLCRVLDFNFNKIENQVARILNIECLVRHSALKIVGSELQLAILELFKGLN